MELIYLLSLTGIAMSLSRWIKLEAAATPFITTALLLSILYLAGLAGLIEPTTYAILGLGIIAFFYHSFTLRRKIFAQSLLTPPVIFWFLFTAIFMFLAKLQMTLDWDSLTHWAPHTKLLFLQHRFVTADINTIHKDYPPGGSIIAYPLLLLHGYYTDSFALSAQNILILSPLALFSRQIVSWKDWDKAFFISLLSIWVLFVFDIEYGSSTSLYMDQPVSLFIAGALIYYFFSPKENVNIAWLYPVIFALMILKIKLFVFALLIGGVIGADQLLNFFLENEKNFKLLALNFLLIFGFLGLALIVNATWSHYLSSIQQTFERNVHFNLTAIYQSLAHPNFDEKLTLQSFFHEEFILSPHYAFILMLIMTGLILSHEKKLRCRLIIANALLLTGFLIYNFCLLILYFYTFTGFEGQHVASMNRYLDVYAMAWEIFAYGTILFSALSRLKIKKFLLIFLTTVLLLANIGNNYFSYHNGIKKFDRHTGLMYRQYISYKIAAKAATYMTDKKPVFIIFQNSAGYEKAAIMSYLVPQSTNQGPSSFGTPYFTGDIWTQPISQQSLEASLKGYGWLLLAYSDDNFWHHYKKLFENSSEKMKPLITFTVCGKTPGLFLFSRRCKTFEGSAYLFKVTQNGDHYHLLNIVSSS